jgi:hypothetical protein
MTTLDMAASYGTLSTAQATQFLADHGLTYDEAYDELGDSVHDAYALCIWIGY